MAFELIDSRLEGPVLLAPAVYGDARGFLLECYHADELAVLGIRDQFVQDNHSRSRRGVVRGIHFKVGPGMAKLVRCSRGSILDVVVDLRVGSPTFGEGFQLDDENHRVAYVPIGFGHAFCVTSDSADVLYRCSTYYEPEHERGIAWDDPDVGIAWPDGLELSVSERDAGAPRLSEVADELPLRYA
jgi:dTDP-4-dehydrorhamnose 3,5-epimerase